MSEEINNRQYRQKVLMDLITQLHNGKTVDEVKNQFAAAFEGVSAEEIALAEQALIAGGLPVSEVQRLCDVHAAVFEGSIEEIHQPTDPLEIPGHPVNILKRENRAIEKLIGQIRGYLYKLPDENTEDELKAALEKLTAIDRHYLKKENLIFPYMEKYGITAPPKVMWGVDDEIRGDLKALNANLKTKDAALLKDEINAVLQKVADMIFKEENIMLPMLLENLTQDEWKRIADDSEEIGYCLITRVPVWNPAAKKEAEAVQSEMKEPDTLTLPTGVLKTEELTHLLNTLPVDITFVDKDDTVKYFSQSAERIFPRTKSIIGRKVVNCHPPASAHIVLKIVEDLKSGKKDHEDFWIKLGGKYIYIRYFAVRNEAGKYLGVLEVTQDIKPIQEITGEKRLVSV
jgi:PAS domain S-box-containing protein